jgi:hypothetical protein
VKEPGTKMPSGALSELALSELALETSYIFRVVLYRGVWVQNAIRLPLLNLGSPGCSMKTPF